MMVFLKGPPEDVLKSQEFQKVPMLIGVTNHEFGWMLPQVNYKDPFCIYVSFPLHYLHDTSTNLQGLVVAALWKSVMYLKEYPVVKIIQIQVKT